MEKSLLPHQRLFDELQIAMLPIARDLPIVQSMLKWALNTIEREGLPTCLIYQNPTEKLSHLHKSTKEFSRPLKELMSNIPSFAPFVPIRKALLALHTSYANIPSIDAELHLLHLGEDPLEDKELLLTLLSFTENLAKLQQSMIHLKKSLLDEMLHHVTLSLNHIPK